MNAPVIARHGDWMQTFTGRAFWPLDPRPEEVSLEDIAHSLSMQCRYAGHVSRFYSVAEHCVLMAQRYLAVGGGDQVVLRQMLMHDAPEAYLVDLPRPVKHSMPLYAETEEKVWQAICIRFQMYRPMLPIVKEFDNRILHDEKAALLSRSPMPWNLPHPHPLGVKIRGWMPEQAKAEFLHIARAARL